MQKRGRPKIYYDFSSILKKHRVEEPLDIMLKDKIINITQYKLALKLRWMFTVNFGLPTVQAYNPGKIPGRGISKYDEEELFNIRQEYKRITEFLYKEDKIGAKVLLNIIIHHKVVSKDIELIKSCMETLEIAFRLKKKMYNTINNNIQSKYVN